MKQQIKNVLKTLLPVKQWTARFGNLERRRQEDLLSGHANVQREMQKLQETLQALKMELDVLRLDQAAVKSGLVDVRREMGYQYYKGLHPDSYIDAIKDWYKLQTGTALSLDNPRTFNEKIQWLKIYDSTPQKTRLADKYLCRNWVEEKIGEKYLVPLLGVWDKFDDIDFAALPNQFVLKANHGCGWNIIVKDKDTLDKDEAKRKMDRWLCTNFAFVNNLELHYKDIPPKIIAEQYLENEGKDLYDYKVWCFNGKPSFIAFLAERPIGVKIAFHDLDWNLLPFSYLFPRYEKPVPRPDNLDEILKMAEVLCKDFAHVRVDFYRLDDGSVKFGEMTFTTASGYCIWDPPEYDLVLGQMLSLPDVDVVSK